MPSRMSGKSPARSAARPTYPEVETLLEMVQNTNEAVRGLTETLSRTIEQVQALATTTQVLATNDANIRSIVDQLVIQMRTSEETRFKLVRENEAEHARLGAQISAVQLADTAAAKGQMTSDAVQLRNWIVQAAMILGSGLLGFILSEAAMHWK